MSIKLKINQKSHQVDCNPEMPLLWVLRDILKLKGTKFGCGKGLCGTCTVHIDGVATKSCQRKIKTCQKSEIFTIEALSQKGDHRIQKIWAKHNVPQCGYCQPGQIMAALAANDRGLGAVEEPSSSTATQKPSHKNKNTDEVLMQMSGNICRCGTYQRIKEAITEYLTQD